MDSANYRLDELVAFGAGLQLQNWQQPDDISEELSLRFSRGQIDYSKYAPDNPQETGNPQLEGLAELACLDRQTDLSSLVQHPISVSFLSRLDRLFHLLQDFEEEPGARRQAMRILDNGCRFIR